MISMNKLKLSLVFLFLSIGFLHAQKYEFGISAGGTNYIGDVGRQYYFYHNKIGGGLVFKNTINPWMSLRMGGNFLPIYADDAQAENKGRNARGLKVDGRLLEFSFGIEYKFLPKNPYIRHLKSQRITPYMFTGMSFVNYSGNLSKNEGFTHQYSGANIGIPMILGIKMQFAEHLLIAFESGARYNFTDNLDGTNDIYNNKDILIKGGVIPSTNTNSNDWYTFTSVSLIYTFGDLSCYFGF